MLRPLLLPTLLTLISSAASFANQAPVLNPLTAAKVPGGKSLVLPLSATDADGDPLTFTVTSSSPSIIARVKSGLPFLKFNINHESSGSGDPAFSGTMALALFRDWTPRSADLIGGLAQAGFYDGVIFQRLEGGNALSFIQGGASTDNVNYQASFRLLDEYKPQLIYSGDAQLALAKNAPDSNSSQFFITSGPQRALPGLETNSGFDFNYTNFGQTTRGADLINSILGTAQTMNSDGSGTPVKPVTITSATVDSRPAADGADAVLLLSAPGTDTPATITVTATDPSGLSSVQTFMATPVTDTADDPPVLVKPTVDQTVARGTVVTIPLSLVDLEFDPLVPVYSTAQGSVPPSKTQSAITSKSFLLLTPPSFRGAINLQLGRREAGTQTRGNLSLGSSYFDVADYDFFNLSVGDGTYSVKPAPIEAKKGVALTSIVVAKLISVPQDAKPTFTASINWGDNTITGGLLVKNATGYNIIGSHTYARAGAFPMSVIVRDEFTVKNGTSSTSIAYGAKREADFTAYVMDAANAPITVRGEKLSLPKKGKFKGTVATFTDAANTAAVASDYAASIDWGNGQVSAGTVQKKAGAFTITGTNTYADADDYSVAIRVTPVSSGADSTGYSRLHVGGQQISMPPFRNIDLQGKWLQLKYANTGAGTTLVGKITGQYRVTNAGALDSAPAVVTFYYSADMNSGNDTSLGQLNVPTLKPGKSAILKISAQTGADSAPLSLPAGVDFSNPSAQNASIITNLHATHVAPLIIDVNHFYVDRPVAQ